MPQAPVSADVLAPFQQQWAELPVLPEALLEALQRRFRELQATLEQNLERKKVWCVCMEIIAGMESPPAFAQLRMEYQVARLSASLAGAATKTEALYDPQRLQEQWRQTGALPADQEVELDARFMNAVRAWQQRED